jgi:hypothetical protein
MQSKYKQCLNRLSQIIDNSISNCMSFLMSSVQRFETETLADMSEIHIHNYESLDKTLESCVSGSLAENGQHVRTLEW